MRPGSLQLAQPASVETLNQNSHIPNSSIQVDELKNSVKWNGPWRPKAFIVPGCKCFLIL